jgi:hypothetical protein
MYRFKIEWQKEMVYRLEKLYEQLLDQANNTLKNKKDINTINLHSIQNISYETIFHIDNKI